MNIKEFLTREITRDEAIELSKLKGAKLMELFAVANEMRETLCGDTIHTCTISNAKSGKCEEDCKFCAQSAYYTTGVKEYPLKDEETLMKEYDRADFLGAKKFGVVTSGKSILKGSKDFETITNFTKEAKDNDKNPTLCCSIGMLNDETLKELQDAGVTRVHNNLQTSERIYSEIVASTHEYQDRVNSIKKSQAAGMEICSGGIIGMGETWEDRIDMALALKELNVDGIPINILNPIPGTPMGEREHLEMNEILKSIAIYRIILRDKVVKLGAGRESILKDFQGMAFMAGANGMLVGGYLTTKGRQAEEDFKLMKNIREMWGK